MDYEQQLQSALTSYVSGEDTSVLFYDVSILLDRVDRVVDTFPKGTHHCVAIKSNPITRVLQEAASAGLQAEAASYGEFVQADRIPGFNHLVFDSPAKTAREIESVCQNNRATLNINSFEELAFVPENPKARIGLRINPLVGSSADTSMSVAGAHSKFGIPISDFETILNAFIKYPFLTGLHVHTSSQSDDYKKMVEGIRAVIDLRKQITEKIGNRIFWLDIGGGFPVDYSSETTHEITAYGRMLRKHCPELWEPELELYTEFGRYYHAHAGFSATKIASVKHYADREVLISHLGADHFVRESYNRELWPHQFFLMDSTGKLKTKEVKPSDLGGPLCFGGDFFAKNVSLPAAEAGDWLIIADTGANTYSLWSHHCSRPFPKMIVRDQNGKMFIGKQRQDLHDTIRFWD